MLILLCIILPLNEGHLCIKDNFHGPSVFFIQRFHCTCTCSEDRVEVCEALFTHKIQSNVTIFNSRVKCAPQTKDLPAHHSVSYWPPHGLWLHNIPTLFACSTLNIYIIIMAMEYYKNTIINYMHYCFMCVTKIIAECYNHRELADYMFVLQDSVIYV